MTKRLTPYQRIVRAAEKGVGVRLSYDECFSMLTDTAITDRASLDDDELELENGKETKHGC